MKKLLISVASLALITACSESGADKDGDGKITNEEVAAEMNEVNIEAGEWENTLEIVDVKIEGLPEGAPAGMMDALKGQTTTAKSCITKEQAENPGAQFFAAQEDNACEVKKFDMSGGSISSEMSCTNMGAQGAMNMTMDGDYGSSSYEMTMNMNGNTSGMKIDMSAKSSGKRIGDCPS